MTRMMTATLVALTLCATTLGAQAPPQQAKASAAATAPINLNTATLAQLETLPGVGAKLAERIVAYRDKSGGFKKVEDLMSVQGVGEKSFLKLKPMITVAVAKPTTSE